MITFRNSKIVYYGPHGCNQCGVKIAKMGQEWGGTAFTYPDGPVYPNTEWHPHVCDMKISQLHRAICGNCGHPKHASVDGTESCGLCLNEYGRGKRKIENCCSAYVDVATPVE